MRYLTRSLARSLAVAVLGFLSVAALLAAIPTEPYRSSESLTEERSSSFGSRFSANVQTVVTWEFGRTYAEGAPVWTVIGIKSVRSGWLVGGALLIWVLVALPLGIMAGWAHGAVSGALSDSISLISGAPTLISALILSSAGVLVIDQPVTGFALNVGGFTAFVGYTFPVLALAIGDARIGEFMSSVAGRTRTLKSERFIEALKARHAPVWPHVVRGLAAPVATSLAGNLSYLLGGAIIVEFIFNLSGLAQAVYQGIAGSVVEVELVLGISLVFIVVVLAGRMTAEVIAWITDPRLRTS